jgi:hypothetical protein
MKRIFVSLIIGVAVAFGYSLPAKACIIEIQPSTNTVNLGETVSVDIVVSQRDQPEEAAITAFDLDVAYDDSIISLTDASFGTNLGEPDVDSYTDTIFSYSGLQDLYQDSYFLDDEIVDLNMQPDDSFTLATLTFDATGLGSTELSFVGDWLEVVGLDNTVLDVSYISGFISVVDGSSTAVPELDPNTANAALAFLIGCILVLSGRRRFV